MPRPLVIYFATVKVYGHTRRVYVASRTKRKVQDLYGMGAANLTAGDSGQIAIGNEKAKGNWTPTFIDQDTEESVWLEKRDHDEEGYFYADMVLNYRTGSRDKATRRPSNPEAWIHAATLAICQETLTSIIDNALKARGIPREEL